MNEFDYGSVLPKLMIPRVVAALGDIREYRGKQALYIATRPDVLDRLVEIAKIQSTDASNRIENISTSNRRLRELMAQKTTPQNRNEEELAGYRYVLDLIHESYDSIPVSPNVILQLHRELYRFSSAGFAGKWKDADNEIAQVLPTGETVTRFVSTSAVGTPYAIEYLCAEYSKRLREGSYDPIIVSLLFIFDFVCIHPFNDGNGRMSRLLTLLLLYRNGYMVGRYVSIEKEIEKTKSTYYDALATSSVGWQNGGNDYAPFVTYMLGIILGCYKEADERFARLASSSSNEDALRTYFGRLVGTATKREIMDANPTMSQRTIERILKKLQDERVIEMVGAARASAYRRV